MKKLLSVLIILSLSFSVTMAQNKEVVQKYFDEVVNNHNLSALKTLFAADYIWHSMDGRVVNNKTDNSHSNTLQFIFKAIPDIKYTIENIVSESDWVAVNTTVTGTAKAEMFGFEPTQKKVSFSQMFFFRLQGGKIIEEWEVLDMDKIKRELTKK